MSAGSPIRNVSDTARWVAVYRAMETERPDSLFKDPYARRLAGERGEEIVRALPQGKQSAWPMVVRTCVLDELILKAVRELGAKAVVNLASGLDTRPYRLDLPAELRWVEVDLPDMQDYKEAKLAGERPKCRLERVKLDLADAAQRRQLFERLNGAGLPTLILSEGLLIYLDEPHVAALAGELSAQPNFKWWLIDRASPELLAMLEKRWGPTLRAGNSPMKFAPAEGSAWFSRYGWRPAEERWMTDEARRLGREMPFAWVFRLLGFLMSEKRREMVRRFSSLVLFERA